MNNEMKLNGQWMLHFIKNEDLRRLQAGSPKSRAALDALGFPCIPAEVPGNFELDLLRAGIIDNPFYGSNVWKMQDFENYHLFYSRNFSYDGAITDETWLCFDGIDTIADIYLNGQLLAQTDNMFLRHEFPVKGWLKQGENDLLVHIKPACLEARKRTLPVACHALPYNYGSLGLRKAAHSFGWDIMPRIISAGIWKSVYVKTPPKSRIDDVFCYTRNVDTQKNSAYVGLFYHIAAEADSLKDYRLRVEGVCGESRFDLNHRPWHTAGKIEGTIRDVQFWWPKNRGEPNLYRVKMTLTRGDEICDEREFDFGVRTVSLERTSTISEQGEGEFCFRVNGEKVFCMGTNWVPLDAFHSNDKNRLPKALEMLDDLGCNMVRCWGGNVYEDEEFFTFCDRHGIMVWQDFAMGCAIYPMDGDFLRAMETEAVQIIKRLRSHASLVLWAGDNECDQAFGWAHGSANGDPNKNKITRWLLPDLLDMHDFTRPYLPSSPYIDEAAYQSGAPISEDHLWGPRDYFKGDYYRSSVCCFASETGYHGCPSVESLKKFISPEQLWPMFDANGKPKPDWLAHAADMDDSGEGAYAYRIALMEKQAITLFGSAGDSLADFVQRSQISQAEAKKYFIERFRIAKWRKTGILWWNLLDGWPQISDAVVDYYFSKKLAYHYIKRSQQQVCLMFDEPQDGALTLYAVSDSMELMHLTYQVTNITSGETVLRGEAELLPQSSAAIGKIQWQPQKSEFYYIEWKRDDGAKGTNHCVSNTIDLDFAEYMRCVEECGLLGDCSGNRSQFFK